MNFIEEIKKRAKENIKTIVLPETMDRRVLEAGVIAIQEGIANIIFIGDEESIKSTNPDLDFTNTKFINPHTSELTNTFTNELYELRKHKGMTPEEAHRLLVEDYMYFACMLVQDNMADGVVSGACHSSANTLRPSLQIIKTKPDTELVSAFFLMVVPNCEYGNNGVFIFADSGLVQDPNPTELAAIAHSSAESFQGLVGSTPYVAMLSHSTMGSAKHELVDKVIEATKIAKEKYPDLNIDGELQLDAAIVPEVASSKAPNSLVAGKANVLIFPNLDAGNIGYKLVQRLAKAEAYGPITQGIKKPINDLSRGCSTSDIVGTIAITAVQAQ